MSVNTVDLQIRECERTIEWARKFPSQRNPWAHEKRLEALKAQKRAGQLERDLHNALLSLRIIRDAGERATVEMLKREAGRTLCEIEEGRG